MKPSQDEIAEAERKRVASITSSGCIPARRRVRLSVGLDIGQVSDPVAACAMRSIEEPIDEIDTSLIQKLARPRYEIVGLKRLPLGTSYPNIVSYCRNLMLSPALAGASLIMDRTGCGRPTYDLFVDAGLSPIGVTITSSIGEPTRDSDGSGWHVGKLHLVSRLQTEFACGNLKLPRRLPETEVFLAELRNFAVQVNSNGYASFNAVGSGHDDLVSAASLSIFDLAPQSGGAWTNEPLPF